ncbi:hypothetical protein DPEC_G00001980 [Dallia pectoralis]|uniref:Uncharacterized protein n=1 Tax=Dallia pectoralis TaxID=75939 RepID=A0ACC2HJ65_DALPE|nr:hypothetical protein DPEC_G00001980 [Dallia pectoralis]
MTDHTYSMDTLHVAGGDGDVEEEMDEMLHPAKRDRINKDHTPIKQQQLKKMKPKDFSKDDREARAKLWPRIQEARKAGKRAFLKEGYALIDNKRVDPD